MHVPSLGPAHLELAPSHVFKAAPLPPLTNAPKLTEAHVSYCPAAGMDRDSWSYSSLQTHGHGESDRIAQKHASLPSRQAAICSLSQRGSCTPSQLQPRPSSPITHLSRSVFRKVNAGEVGLALATCCPNDPGTVYVPGGGPCVPRCAPMWRLLTYSFLASSRELDPKGTRAGLRLGDSGCSPRALVALYTPGPGVVFGCSCGQRRK